MPEQEAADEAEEQDAKNPLDDPEKLKELYHDEEMTQAEIAEDYDTTSSTVSHYMTKHDIETRGADSVDERADDPEWLEDAYWGDTVTEGGATMQEIANELECSDGTVMRRLHEHDIDVRQSPIADDEDEEEEGAESEETEE